ncbi:MAG: 2-oxoacid:acceptor oxidoreductase subunit alpha [Candidatus Omnitrophica bacterium]|nr:2-oxoacid:acceptor oxidoreductase subunit alpha [Candidatus Omnitrophota bacterium]
MVDSSVLIGGKAGFGIDKSQAIIGQVFNQLGFRLYIYRDYPSVIRGGHTFSIIRVSSQKISCHKNQIDFLLALNQDTLNFHQHRLKNNSVVIYDADSVKLEGLAAGMQTAGIPLTKITKEENAPEIMRNTCIIAAFFKAVGIKWDFLETVFRKEITKDTDLNLKVAQRSYNEAKELKKIEPLKQPMLALLDGNQAIGLGLIRAGLKTYIAYPMTPSSSLLHFLASVAKDFSLKVIHPESEIAVILMALGCAYAGEKVAVGTSGGGFCLMTEGLSFVGMGELPVVIMVGQRTGPSTGLPTYTAQSELLFILSAGHGEFPRLVVAPGDAEEAYFWSAVSLNFAWKYQLPVIILSDKTLSEGIYSFDIDSIDKIKEEEALLWDRKSPYKRYLNTDTGISPLTFVPDRDAVVKVNSYEHDEFGITTEEPSITTLMQDKRLRKEKYLLKELEGYEPVRVYGNSDATVALLCWGSNKGVCIETAQRLGLKVVQLVVFLPFPARQFQESLKDVKKIICVENNATGQLARLINGYGFRVDEKILKYDGRPFSLDELEGKVKEKIKWRKEI